MKTELLKTKDPKVTIQKQKFPFVHDFCRNAVQCASAKNVSSGPQGLNYQRFIPRSTSRFRPEVGPGSHFLCFISGVLVSPPQPAQSRVFSALPNQQVLHGGRTAKGRCLQATRQSMVTSIRQSINLSTIINKSCLPPKHQLGRSFSRRTHHVTFWPTCCVSRLLRPTKTNVPCPSLRTYLFGVEERGQRRPAAVLPGEGAAPAAEPPASGRSRRGRRGRARAPPLDDGELAVSREGDAALGEAGRPARSLWSP